MKKKVVIFAICFLASSVLQADTEPFYFPIRQGDLEKVQELIEQGYDVNEPIFDADVTPLVQATSDVYLPIMQALLAAGADPNPCSHSRCGLPLFVYAFAGTRYNHDDPRWSEITDEDVIEAFKLLIAHGADVNEQVWWSEGDEKRTLVEFLEESKDREGKNPELVDTLITIIKEAGAI